MEKKDISKLQKQTAATLSCVCPAAITELVIPMIPKTSAPIERPRDRKLFLAKGFLM
jgi:hypothetical protein